MVIKDIVAPSQCTGDNHVSKRDTWLHDTDNEDHHISKAVLLHTLGNAALNRSKRHIINHALPNRGHQMWRRAALDALRHYKCEEVSSGIAILIKSFCAL